MAGEASKVWEALPECFFFLSREGSSSFGATAPGGRLTETNNCSLGTSSCWAEGLENIARRIHLLLIEDLSVETGGRQLLGHPE